MACDPSSQCIIGALGHTLLFRLQYKTHDSTPQCYPSSSQATSLYCIWYMNTHVLVVLTLPQAYCVHHLHPISLWSDCAR